MRPPIPRHIHDAVFAPIESVGQQLERLTVERMEGMCDRENSWEMRITRCNARLTPTLTSRASSRL